MALILVLLALVARANAAIEPVGNVVEVRFEGNTSIKTDDLRAKIKTRANRPVDREQIEKDRQILQDTKWFTDVEAYLDEDPNRKGFIVIFRLREMPVLREVQFLGRKAIRLKDLEESTGLKVGARADHLKNMLSVNQITRLYHEKGYEYAQVHLKEGGKAGDNRVIIQIYEGPKCQLHSVSFKGNEFVSDGVLKTKIACKVPLAFGLGGRYGADEVEEDARKLREYYQSQGFFEVEVQPVKRTGSTIGNIDLEFVVWEGPQYKVRNIVFEGNEKITTATLKAGLVMHSGASYSDNLRDADRKNLETKYGTLGCIDIEIAPEWKVVEGKPGVVDLVYQIKEGEPYVLGHLYVKGNSRTRSKVLWREATQAGLVPGEPIDANRIKAYEKRIGNLRYFNTDPQAGKQLEVKLVNRRPATQPYVDSSNELNLDEVIRTRMQGPDLEALPQMDEPPSAPTADGPDFVPFGASSIFNPPADAVLPPLAAPVAPAPAPGTLPQNANRDVPTPPLGAGEPPGFPSLPGSNMNDVGPDRQEAFPNRSYADIVTSVSEGPTGRFMFGVGASSFQGLSGNFVLHESNFDLFNVPRSFRELFSGQAFRGAGQEFRVDLQPGTLINRAMISFRDPYLFDLPIGLGISGYTFSRVYSDWTEGRTGGRFSLGRQFGTSIYADVAARVEDVNFHGFRIPAPADFLAADGHTLLTTLRPSIRYDNRNDPFSPNKGQYIEAAFEQGWGTFTFPKFTVEGRQYVKTGSRPDGSGVRFITLRGFYGVTGRDTPVYERFFAGDFRSFRGFAYRGIGSHVLGVNVGGLMEAVGSVEYQFPWLASDKLQQVFFCDFGTIESDYTFNTFRASVGTGLRVYLPKQMFGPLPLAFDLAYPVVKEPGDHTRYFHFFIGTMF
ncbi:MAG: BamA/TamA family outer membrane protein [Isosphaeraceae bacterium]